MAALQIIRPGAAKPMPFTIAILANPALERAGAFVVDPIIGTRPAFDAAVRYIDDCLFGKLPHQAERALGDPTIEPHVRVVSIYDTTLTPSAATSLVQEDDPRRSDQLIARRRVVVAFLAKYGIVGDVVFAVSSSPTHQRATAWYTSDDDSRPGVAFTMDVGSGVHRFYNRIPGMCAIHSSAHSMTALHEFQHAIGSYTNGALTDLYVSNPPDVNCRHGRPIPATFCLYNGTTHASDPTRDSLGYPPSWRSYHCALAVAEPALMDNYWKASSRPEACRNDTITAIFVADRVRAKLGR